MRRLFRVFSIYLAVVLFITSTFPVLATQETETTAYPIITTSDSIENWPAGPDIFSGCAVVMEAETGTVLYDKNMNQQAYPASITKIMTALLAIENAPLNEMVEFSEEAVFSIPRDSSHIAITPGELLSVENCLYGLLLASANEVANALAEHVSGTTEEFAKLMNERAKELGATDTNFCNANGLPDENHYTSCYDMAMISREAVANETFVKINSATSYMIPPTNLQPEQRPVNTAHPLLVNGYRHYDGCFGGKTGYTTVAGNTLVTFAERNGMTLICVVMKSDSTHIYADSAALLDYGFENFSKRNISENEKKFNLESSGFFEAANSVFENSYPQISLNKEGIVVLPIGADFSEAEATISFRDKQENDDTNVMADLTYTWHGHFIGSTTLDVVSVSQKVFSFASETQKQEIQTPSYTPETEPHTTITVEDNSEKEVIRINIWVVTAVVLGASALIGLGFLWYKTKEWRDRWKRIWRQKRQARRIERRHRRRKFYPTRKLK